MAKFISHDGIDNHGVRAEVMVQTGTGRIKEIAPRGKQAEDGSYRNYEVVFDPDNPHLKRKVYALLDTTAKELWDYVQAAQADQRDISYRIESQRKRNVDRTKKFDDLEHAEEVVRVLAAIDTVFSHEAKTNPKEDPTGDNPSALEQNIPTALTTSPSPTGDLKTILLGLAAARAAGLPATTVDTLAGLALAAGASIDEVLGAGLEGEGITRTPQAVNSRVAASEEKPWMAYNSDGRVNAGSYMVAHAATAERFALDHLIAVYSEGKKSNVDVSSEMIAQAASIALVLLELADEVQVRTVGRIDRQKNSYNRSLSLVLDGVEKRYPAPVGGNNEAQQSWREQVVSEAAERLYGVLEVAQGRLPLSEAERQTTTAAAPAKAPNRGSAEELLTAELGARIENSVPANAVIFSEGSIPAGEEGFIEPGKDLIERVRALCVEADVAGDAKAVSDWLERTTGARTTRRIHAPVLEAFLTHYEQAGPQVVRAEVLGASSAA